MAALRAVPGLRREASSSSASWRLRSSGAERLLARPLAALPEAPADITGVVALCCGVFVESVAGRRGAVAADGTGSSIFGVCAESLGRSLGVCMDCMTSPPLGTGVFSEAGVAIATSGVCAEGRGVALDGSVARGKVSVRSGVFCEAGVSFGAAFCAGVSF